MASMRAARFHANKDARVEDVPIPVLRPGHVLVDVEWCGLCGSDIHEYEAGPTATPTKDNPHPLTGEHMPSILGHEFCGTVKAVNDGSKFTVGQKVSVNPLLSCQDCPLCSSGRDHQCPKLGFLGYSGKGGGFSEVVPVQEFKLYALPENMPLEYAALIEPLCVGYHAVKLARSKDLSGKSVLIVGGGPIGFAVILNLRTLGCKKIIVSEPTLTRREQTGGLADAIIDPTTENVGEKCRELTGGMGVDIVFDCAGVQRGLEAAVDAITFGGWWINVALWDESPSIPFRYFLYKEINMTASCCYTNEDFREMIELIGQGKFEGCEKMITSRIGLEDFVSKGLQELINNRDKHIKILVTPKKELMQ